MELHIITAYGDLSGRILYISILSVPFIFHKNSTLLYFSHLNPGTTLASNTERKKKKKQLKQLKYFTLTFLE